MGGGSLVKLLKGPVKQNRIPVVYSSSDMGCDAAASSAVLAGASNVL